jgi:hypothetical protein
VIKQHVVTGFLLGQAALKLNMVREAELILASVDFLEKEIDKKLGEVEEAANNYEFDRIDGLQEQVVKLLSKLDRETDNMDAHMLKYRSLHNHAEKEMLFGLSQEKSLPLRSFPTNTGWASSCQEI